MFGNVCLLVILMSFMKNVPQVDFKGLLDYITDHCTILNCFETGLGDHNVFKKFPIYLHITNTVVSIQILLYMRFIHVYVLNVFLQFLITMPQPLKEKLLLSTLSCVLDWALLLAVCLMTRQPYK